MKKILLWCFSCFCVVALAQTPGLDLENMDLSVKPQDDFYSFVNGNWMKTNTIPEDKSSWGSFYILRKNVDDDMLAIMEELLEADFDAAEDKGKAITLFKAYLNEEARDDAGYQPLIDLLNKIDAVESIEAYQELVVNEMGISSPYISFSVFPDLNNSAINAGYLGSGGLGLERDYYLSEDSNSKDVLEKYKKHIEKMFGMIGYKGINPEKIVELETLIAPNLLSKEERRDTRNYNNYRALTQVEETYSFMNWRSFFKDLGLDNVDSVFVSELKYFDFANTYLTEENLEDIKLLTKWKTLDDHASKLTPELEYANWEFYGKELRGAKKPRPANERALAVVNRYLGEALGQLYVDAKFPPEAKESAKEMVSYLKKAFDTRIQNLDWMSEETKEKAIDKLYKMGVKIGYPDTWKDYSKCEITPSNSYFENRLALSKFLLEKDLSEFGKPVDKSEWYMSPQTVNAYYSPLNNEIVFPAAILRSPFFNHKADMAVNFGAMGAVIGHEISHGFDDSGARFDANGNLKNWWQEEDLENFTARGKQLADQFSAVEVLDSVFVNGEFTLGENIGDLGGLLAAYDGLQLYLKDKGHPGKIDGFTPEQRFFISWATIWRTLVRDEYVQTMIKTDPHSPGQIRAVQPLLNIQAFYDAFDIKPGDPMHFPKENRVFIW